MTALTSNLIKETDELLSSVKKHYLAIAANLYRIKNSRKWLDNEWVEFYQTRELKKAAVSKLLKVGEFVLAHGFAKETVSYENLYLSINAHKDGDPKHILAEAKTWRQEDYKDEARDTCLHPKPPITVCPDCFRRMEV